MSENREDQAKLIPENQHQILSVFFIVACLLGVFFTLGYIVGRNSPFLIGPSTAFAREKDPAPAHATASTPSIELSKAPAKASALVAKAATPAPTGPKQAKSPATDLKAEASATPPALADGQPTGTYLQLVATSKAGVDAVVDALRQKGFNAQGVPIPGKQGWFRALVGPLEHSAINTTRTELQAAGFPGQQAIAKNF